SVGKPGLFYRNEFRSPSPRGVERYAEVRRAVCKGQNAIIKASRRGEASRAVLSFLRCRGGGPAGRAPCAGPGGRRFKSSLPDHLSQAIAGNSGTYILGAIRATGNCVANGMWKPRPACSAVTFR